MNYTMSDRNLGQNRSLITISGRLTSANAAEVKKNVHDIISRGEHELVFDLSGITFIDSSGLSVFVSILRTTREAGGWMKLAALAEMPGEIFRITHLDRVIELYPNIETALRSEDEITAE